MPSSIPIYICTICVYTYEIEKICIVGGVVVVVVVIMHQGELVVEPQSRLMEEKGRDVEQNGNGGFGAIRVYFSHVLQVQVRNVESTLATEKKVERVG